MHWYIRKYVRMNANNKNNIYELKFKNKNENKHSIRENTERRTHNNSQFTAAAAFVFPFHSTFVPFFCSSLLSTVYKQLIYNTIDRCIACIHDVYSILTISIIKSLLFLFAQFSGRSIASIASILFYSLLYVILFIYL